MLRTASLVFAVLRARAAPALGPGASAPGPGPVGEGHAADQHPAARMRWPRSWRHTAASRRCAGNCRSGPATMPTAFSPGGRRRRWTRRPASRSCCTGCPSPGVLDRTLRSPAAAAGPRGAGRDAVACAVRSGPGQSGSVAADLWSWAGVLHYVPHITFRPTGGGPGTLWLGAGAALGENLLSGTLIVLHARDHEEPWLLLTNTQPDRTDVDPASVATGSNRASGASSGAAGSGTARAGGTPCAWPGTCWPATASGSGSG